MKFDPEGRLIVSPKEVQQLVLANSDELVHHVLLSGTPHAFESYRNYCGFLNELSDRLHVNPRNLCLRGSAKLGFSISPKPEKLWRQMRENSDLDLAIVDSGFFSRIDDQVRTWERKPPNRSRIFHTNTTESKRLEERRRTKGKFECFRHFDLPRVDGVVQLYEQLNGVRTEAYCGRPRALTAFIFRDWWGVFQRYSSDLHDLRKGLRRKDQPLPQAGDEPFALGDLTESD